MLTRRIALVFTIMVSLLAVGIPAYADPPIGTCPPDQPDCSVSGKLPPGPGNPGGGGGNGGGGGGNGMCNVQGEQMPCYLDGVGTFNPDDGCYYQLANPQGPPNPDGTPGAWYERTCFLPGGMIVGQVLWLANPPPGLGPTPAQLAQQALAKIRLLGAQIGVAPSPNGAGLVGLPVWLWTAVTPNTWGPITASASAGALTVTITGHATKIVWDMGDGSVITCANPGTPYQPAFGSQPSPTCGYVYRQASRNRPGGVYRITATTYWQVDWSGGGVSGVINTTRQSQANVEIQELQVVTS